MISFKTKTDDNKTNSFDNQKDHLISIKNNIDNIQNELSNSNIHLNFITEDNDKPNKNNKSRNILNLSSNGSNTPLFDKDEEQGLMNIIEEGNKNEEEKEKSLQYLYHKYMNSYKKRKYGNIVKDINNKNDLLYNSSLTSFNIFILKIRCQLKILKEEFLKMTKFEENNIDINKKISKILKDFKVISTIVNQDNKENYELLTKVYCKFLLYLSLISKIREEYIKSFQYLIMGINSLKIFFIRQEIASDISLYSMYCKFLLLVINQLIGDNNYKTALTYCNITFKVLEVSFRYMKTKSVNPIYKYKFLVYTGYIYLYIGLCFEQNKEIDYISCLEAYKEANFFLRKSELNNDNNNGEKKRTIVNGNENENIHLFLSAILVEKCKKMQEENNNEIKKIKTKEIKFIEKPKENKDKAKSIKLHLISSGLAKNNKKDKLLENLIDNHILTSNIQNNIEKLDDELISIIYKDNINNCDSKKPISNNTKRDLYHLKIYNILLSNQFREYILKNKNFEFNNPNKEKQSINSLQRFINNTNLDSGHPSTIKLNYNSRNKNKRKNIKNMFKMKLNKYDKKRNIFSFSQKINFSDEKTDRNNNYNNTINKTTFHLSLSSPKNTNILNNNNNNKTTNNIGYIPNDIKQKLFNQIYKLNYNNHIDDNKKRIMTICKNNSEALIIKSINFDNKKKYNFRKIKIQKKQNKIRSPINKTTKDNTLTNNYFKKFFYLDSLTTKELSFQKKMLGLKDNNSKLFFKLYTDELKNEGKTGREDAYKKFLELNEKAMDAVKRTQEDELNKQKSMNIFENQNHIFRVLSRYISSSKKTKEKRFKIYSESYKNIKKNNEEKLIVLNSGIKKLSYILSYKNKKLKNSRNEK